MWTFNLSLSKDEKKETKGVNEDCAVTSLAISSRTGAAGRAFASFRYLHLTDKNMSELLKEEDKAVHKGRQKGRGG